MSRAWVVCLVALAACGGPPTDGETQPAAAAVGVETTEAAVEEVRDVITAFGAVTAWGETAEVRDARAQLAQAESRRALAETQVRRLERLARGGIAPQKELEAARSDLAVAGADAARAREVLDGLGGAREAAGSSERQRLVTAWVVQRDMPAVQRDAPAVLRPDAFPGRAFSGRVDAEPTYVSTGTGLAPVRVRIDDPDGVLRPGMTGELVLTVGDPRRVVTVPEGAVLFDGTRYVVIAGDETGALAPRPVTVGARSGDRVEVSGVPAGTAVVTTGAASVLSAAALATSGPED